MLQLFVSMISSSRIRYIRGKALKYHLAVGPKTIFPSSLPSVSRRFYLLELANANQDRNPCSRSDKPVSLISVNPETRARAIQACTRRPSVYIEQEEGEYRSSEQASERRLCFSIRRTKPESWGRVCEETNSTWRRARPRFSHCLPSICRFKYICSHLNGPFPDNLYAKRIAVKEPISSSILCVAHCRFRTRVGDC